MIEKIRREIEKVADMYECPPEIDHGNDYWYKKGMYRALQIVEKIMKKEKKMIGIKIKENGDYYSVDGCGTTDNFYEITKEEYERVKSYDNYIAMLNDEYEAEAPEYILCGYGFYGCRLVRTELGHYYYVVTIGNSCE